MRAVRFLKITSGPEARDKIRQTAAGLVRVAQTGLLKGPLQVYPSNAD